MVCFTFAPLQPGYPSFTAYCHTSWRRLLEAAEMQFSLFTLSPSLPSAGGGVNQSSSQTKK